MRRMAGRPTVITAKIDRQLEALLDAGVTQGVAASALGIGRRTVTRWVARRRRSPETLEELVASLPTVEELLAQPSRPPNRPRRNKGRPAWRDAAEALEAAYGRRWGVSGEDVDDC
jgi:hypothetical protein